MVLGVSQGTRTTRLYPADMNVAEAMTPRSAVVTVELPGTRDDVLEYLQERQFSSVPVVTSDEDGEQYRGLVSRDALIERPDEDQLALLMAENVPTTTPETPIAAVAELMVTNAARRVPVLDADDSLAGIITVTDLVTAIARGDTPGDTAVGTLASETVTTTWQETPLPVVERELSFAGTPYAVVLDDTGRMAGIVTEVDILEVARVVAGETDTGDSIADEDDEWMWEGIKAVGARYMPTRDVEIPSAAVSEYMTADVLTIGRTRTVREAAQQMIEHDIEQVPLLAEGRLGGIVLDMDLLEALYE